MVSDTEDNASDLEVEWRSSLDGTLISAAPTVNGQTIGEVTLSQGTHQIELYVEDTEGASHMDSVSIQVREPNEPPTCEFISPEDGTIAESGDVIQFQALVLRPERV